MEHLSKIELIGRVGAVREFLVGDQRLVRFGLGVDTVFSGGAGSVAKTTWFNCTYWGDRAISKGQELHLEGRIIGQDYMDSDGRARQAFEVKVNKIW